MSFITKLLVTIGGFFASLFQSTEKAYDQLSEAEKKVSQEASGLLAIINANLKAVPVVVWQLIQTAYPGISQDKVTAALIKAGQVMGAIDDVFDGSFADALVAIQGYLSGLEGNTWVVVTKAIVAIVADIFLPGTIIQKIELVLEYVYQTFIKGKVVQS